jgi:hypothetical protein
MVIAEIGFSLGERVRMMVWWANYLDELRVVGQVVPIKRVHGYRTALPCFRDIPEEHRAPSCFAIEALDTSGLPLNFLLR